MSLTAEPSLGSQRRGRGTGSPESGYERDHAREYDDSGGDADQGGNGHDGNRHGSEAVGEELPRPAADDDARGDADGDADDADGDRLPENGAHDLTGGEPQGSEYGKVAPSSSHGDDERVGDG